MSTSSATSVEVNVDLNEESTTSNVAVNPQRTSTRESSLNIAATSTR
jgi:hypothetical protein